LRGHTAEGGGRKAEIRRERSKEQAQVTPAFYHKGEVWIGERDW